MQNIEKIDQLQLFFWAPESFRFTKENFFSANKNRLRKLSKANAFPTISVNAKF